MFPSATFFPIVYRLNVSLTKFYPDKSNKNKDYNFYITFFSLSVTLYSVLAAKLYWHFSVNKFKTLDKTNKINTILCRLKLYVLALGLGDMAQNMITIFWASLI